MLHLVSDQVSLTLSGKLKNQSSYRVLDWSTPGANRNWFWDDGNMVVLDDTITSKKN